MLLYQKHVDKLGEVRPQSAICFSYINYPLATWTHSQILKCQENGSRGRRQHNLFFVLTDCSEAWLSASLPFPFGGWWERSSRLVFSAVLLLYWQSFAVLWPVPSVRFTEVFGQYLRDQCPSVDRRKWKWYFTFIWVGNTVDWHSWLGVCESVLLCVDFPCYPILSGYPPTVQVQLGEVAFIIICARLCAPPWWTGMLSLVSPCDSWAALQAPL